jgi:hypothetical protein
MGMGRTNLSSLRPGLAALLAAVALLALPSRPAAHEIPASVTVLAFVRPEGRHLTVLVRVPLESMRDIVFPLRGPGYLDIAAVTPLLHDAARLWIADYIELYEGDRRLEVVDVVDARISLPSDRSFSSFEQAAALLRAPPLPDATELPWQQAMLDVRFDYRIASDHSKFSIHPALAHLGIRTSTVLRFQPPGGAERAYQYLGDPGLVRLDPRWHQAAFRFVRLGFGHILDGVDHLLFVLCLVIPFRRLRSLVAIITSFTVAHSITLIASAAGLAPTALWFPPLIEALIALSILWMAFENIVVTSPPAAAAGGSKAAARPDGAEDPADSSSRTNLPAALERRWLIAFAFGLVHGFGFSFILRDSLQFAGRHLAASLVAFNVGVELGQLFVLVLAIPVLNWLFRRVVSERMGTILLSALVAHTAWHWMTARAATLSQYDFRWPALDAATLAGLLRGLMLVLIMGGALWLLFGLFGRLAQARSRRGTTAGVES